jgi:hypothetical protein
MGCSLVLTVCRQVKVLGFRVSQTDTRSSWRRVNLVNQQTRSGCLYAVFQPNGCIQKTKNKHRQLRLNTAIFSKCKIVQANFFSRCYVVNP